MSSMGQTYGQTAPEQNSIEPTAATNPQTANPGPQTAPFANEWQSGPAPSMLHELLTVTDEPGSYRLMLRSWFMAYLTDKTGLGATVKHHGEIYENAFFFEALDDFIVGYESQNQTNA